LSIDLVTELGNEKYLTIILVVTAMLLKKGIYIPCVEMPRADSILNKINHQIYFRYGFPKGILSDRGPRFTSLRQELLLRKNCITRKLASKGQVQSDSQSEPSILTLLKNFRIYNDRKLPLSSILPEAEQAGKYGKRLATGFLPFTLTF
jgi:hypothetical protein